MIRTLIGLVLLLWILGFATQVGGSLIHALLVIAAVLFIYDLLTGSRVEV
ncbi:MAG: lmo0937 family membrane protein [Candidatus Melainabacteria bacterium]|nr:MAG: lmo0937 family membrane protein [Candidatus Melainabacteria bacterium]